MEEKNDAQEEDRARAERLMEFAKIEERAASVRKECIFR